MSLSPTQTRVSQTENQPLKARNRWLRAFTILNALGLALLWWLENGVGEETNITALLLYMPQHPLVLPTLLLLLTSLWKRNWWLLRWNVCILCAWLFTFGGLQVGKVPLPFFRGPSPIRIVHWNVDGWQRGVREIPNELMSYQPDIICIADALTGPQRRPKKGEKPVFDQDLIWQQSFPGWHVIHTTDVAILSRYPLLSSRIQKVKGGFDRGLIVATWQTSRGPLTTVATHIWTALKEGTQPNHNYNQPQRWMEIIRNAQLTAQIRAVQWPDIENSVDGISTPFIVAGDFNTPPRGLLYRRLARRWNDVFRQAGWGTGYTFPAHRALIRIDYLWASSNISVKSCVSPATQYSDHRPIIAEINF